jgi:hypothetical protein
MVIQEVVFGYSVSPACALEDPTVWSNMRTPVPLINKHKRLRVTVNKGTQVTFFLCSASLSLLLLIFSFI